ncbi:MAG: hypothetical protein N3A58_04575 [Spirochaetes bacterium]|nr:hypothetical protein [Spirochaetota bacterium]
MNQKKYYLINKINIIIIYIFFLVNKTYAQQDFFKDIYISYLKGNPEIINPGFNIPIKLYQNYKINGYEKILSNNGNLELINNYFILRTDKDSVFYIIPNNDKNIIKIEKGKFYLNFINNKILINFNQTEIQIEAGEYFLVYTNNYILIISSNGKIKYLEEEINLNNENNLFVLSEGKYQLKNIKVSEDFYLYFNKDQLKKEIDILNNYSGFYIDELLFNLDNNNKFILTFEEIKKSQIQLETNYNSISKSLLSFNENEYEPFSLIDNYINYLKLSSYIKENIKYIFNYYLLFYSKCKVIINSYKILESKINALENRINKDTLFNKYFLNNYSLVKNNFQVIKENIKSFEKSIETGKENFFNFKSKIFYIYNYIEESEIFLKKTFNKFIDESNKISYKNHIKILIDLYSNAFISNYSINSNINKILEIKFEINSFSSNLKINYIPEIHIIEGLFYNILKEYYKEISEESIKNLIKSNNLASLFIYLFKKEDIKIDFLTKYYKESSELIQLINVNKVELLKVTKELESITNNLFLTLYQKSLFINKFLKSNLYNNNLKLISSILYSLKSDLSNLYNIYINLNENSFEKKEITFLANFYNDSLTKILNYTLFSNDFFIKYYKVDSINLDVYFSEFFNLNKQLPTIFNLNIYTTNMYIDNFYNKFNTGIISLDQMIKLLEDLIINYEVFKRNISEILSMEYYYLNSKYSLNNTKVFFINEYKNKILFLINNLVELNDKTLKVLEKISLLKSKLEIFYINYNDPAYSRDKLIKNIEEIKNFIDDFNLYFNQFYSEILNFELNLNLYKNFLDTYNGSDSSIIDLINKSTSFINSFLTIIYKAKSSSLLNEIIKILQ